MLLIALAAQMSMPVGQPRGVWDLFSADDVPLDLVPEGEIKRVGVRVTVTPDGKVENCRAESSSGISKLDAYTCSIIERRARFHAAIGGNGQPTYGVIRTIVTWAVDASGGAMPPADLELTVSRLPSGVNGKTSGSLMFLVDAAGHPSFCMEEKPTEPLASKLPPVLVNIACNQLVKSYVAVPARDLSGRAVSSIQNATVTFLTQEPK
jgi:TonB family protein